MNTPDEVVISIRDLRMSFGENEVLKGIDMDIYKGQIIGYIGPNGAGKSTTVKLMLGILNGYEGEIRILGMISATEASNISAGSDMCPNQQKYESLTAQEYLTFVGELYGLDHETQMQGLQADGTVWDRRCSTSRISTYSKGMRKVAHHIEPPA